MAEVLVNNYHKFSLCLPQSGEDVLMFDVMRSNFPNGYQSSAMFGSSAGLRSWKMPFSDLPQFGTLHTFRGKDYNRTEYIRSLFAWQVTTGTPFVIESPVNGQYYLAMFDEDANSLSRKLTAVWNTSINLKQVRLEGVSVFDIDAMDGIWGHYHANYYVIQGFDDNDSVESVVWGDTSPQNNFLGTVGNITLQTNEQNGLPVVRMAGTNSIITRNEAVTIYEAYFVMKVAGATLSAFQGILSDAATVALLIANDSGTIALNQNFNSFTFYEYRKNSILFTEANQQLPMNTFGVVHIRFQEGVAMTDIQIGKQKATSQYFIGDFGEIVLCDQLLSETDSRELTEDLMKRWNI
jgi:hypothetical protein